jgi:phage tail sheath protein FI
VVQATETIQNLRMHDDRTTNFLVTGVNLRSAFVNVQVDPAGYSETDLTQFPVVVASPLTEWLALTGGDDHLEQLTVEDFIGVDGGSGNRTGIQALEDITDISICIVPGMWAESIQSALINHCESLRYRFAILDPPDNLNIDQIISFREPIDTKFAALYYPWIEVLDPSSVVNVDLAPSGHMAGIYALTDNTRGVFKAPANVEIAVISKISQDVNKREQEVLNPIGINALRFFPERGNRVWGARTLSSESAWKYINVKRLFIYVEASIDNGTQWVVFEPNDASLWARVRQVITEFLTTTWRQGALQGTTADQAFFVRCDMTTMTQDDIDNGRLICVIGIAPVKPAEFVIFRIQQYTQATAS